MQFSELWSSLQNSVGTFLPTLIGALAILLVGWILAIVLRAATSRALKWVGLDRRVADTTDRPLKLEAGASRLVYFGVLLMALLAALNALKLDQVSAPLQNLADQVLAFLPRLIAAGVLLLVAWVVATAVRAISRRAMEMSGVDEKISGDKSFSASIANILYALVFVLFLPAVLGALEMNGLLAPVQGMTSEFLAMLPNLFAAAVIGVVGWFVARLVRDLVSGVLSAAGADKLGAKAGLTESASLSKLGGTVVYVLTLVPAAIAALNALQIEAVAEPATLMLSSILEALPQVFAAVLILGVSWLIARLVGDLVRQLAASAGVDQWPHRMGLVQEARSDESLSRFAGSLVVFFVLLFATGEAANRLDFGQLSALVGRFTEFSGQVLLGSVIIALGFWLATLARRAVLRMSGPQSAGLANILRMAILGMVVAMGLRSMGLADDIVNLAFGLTLGAVAVAFSLSFGLGGRAAASRLADSWVNKVEDRASGS